MVDIITVVLVKHPEQLCFGFDMRLMANNEHAIYKIFKNHPADLCYELNVGDVVVSIDGCKLKGLTSKQASARLALSLDKVTIELRRDESIRNFVYNMIRDNSPMREVTEQRRPPVCFEAQIHREWSGSIIWWKQIVLPEGLLVHYVGGTSKNVLEKGELQIGDVIVAVNEKPVEFLPYKKVLDILKCVRYPDKLRIKRDPWIKNYVRALHPESSSMPTLHSTGKQNESPNNDHPGFNREKYSEPRPSRIATANRGSVSVPLSPTSGSKEPQEKSTRYIFTGKTTFLQTRETMTLQSEKTTAEESVSATTKKVFSGGKRRVVPPVRGDTVAALLGFDDEPTEQQQTGGPNNNSFGTNTVPYHEASPAVENVPKYDIAKQSPVPAGAGFEAYPDWWSEFTETPKNAHHANVAPGASAKLKPSTPASPPSFEQPPASAVYTNPAQGETSGAGAKRKTAIPMRDPKSFTSSRPVTPITPPPSAVDGGVSGAGAKRKTAIPMRDPKSVTSSRPTTPITPPPSAVDEGTSGAGAKRKTAIPMRDPKSVTSSRPTTPITPPPSAVDGGASGAGAKRKTAIPMRDPKSSAMSVPTSPIRQAPHQPLSAVEETPPGALNASHVTLGDSSDESKSSLPTSPYSGGGSGAEKEPLVRPEAAADSSGDPASIASSGEPTANTNVSSSSQGAVPVRKCDAAGFRTSRSEYHLQQTQHDAALCSDIPIDIDEDVYSSLNTLLDTRSDSQEQPQTSEGERFFWTFNLQPEEKPDRWKAQQAALEVAVQKAARAVTAQQAARPVAIQNAARGAALAQQASRAAAYAQVQSLSSSISSSPQHSVAESLASPTSMSSSVMSSGGSRDHSANNEDNASEEDANEPPADTTAQTNAEDAGLGDESVGGDQQQQEPQQQESILFHQPLANIGTGAIPKGHVGVGGTAGDHSVSEAVSNLSSPDYQDEHDLFSAKDLMTMAISDHSDSDSTILASETTHRLDMSVGAGGFTAERDHKLVIEVIAAEVSQESYNDMPKQLQQQEEQQPLAPQEEQQPLAPQEEQQPLAPQEEQLSEDDEKERDRSPTTSEFRLMLDGKYSPKPAVCKESVERLASRMFLKQHFQKKDICRILCKDNKYVRMVGDVYMKNYDFTDMSLDEALRAFVKEELLYGETQERVRVMRHFSRRYFDNNPGVFNSIDEVQVVVCALLILNADTHGKAQIHVSFSMFMDNVRASEDGRLVPKELLKQLFNSIKAKRLESAPVSHFNTPRSIGSLPSPVIGSNPFLEAPRTISAVVFKKGYVVRKSCYEANHKKTSFGRRSWKMFYCALRELVMYLHLDENSFKRNQMSDQMYNCIRLHHAFATRATDYSKRQHVFRLQTADQCEFLFQTSDNTELDSWINTINYMCAFYSAPPLEGAVGSQGRFHRPLLPCSSTKLSPLQQMASHEAQYRKLSRMHEELKAAGPPPKGTALENYREKDAYLQHEILRYETYWQLLNLRLTKDPQEFANLYTVSAAALSGTSMMERRVPTEEQPDNNQQQQGEAKVKRCASMALL